MCRLCLSCSFVEVFFAGSIIESVHCVVLWVVWFEVDTYDFEGTCLAFTARVDQRISLQQVPKVSQALVAGRTPGFGRWLEHGLKEVRRPCFKEHVLKQNDG